ncbi:SIS domain-containing protein [Pseudodesulfovibrio sp. zrk46]|uniref:SIS domain-containing protein n=1 Tax=Pseudodesulfovibrio sp. zrk46 TaxID=2725288 RepID=UPI00144A1181|nr:SIS domain-containing protein [Pseudodesulfovibrio sp. zrk46]QJB55750.1 SIS domain-containing protein [Pseudodesulfovibrio sp. zrk46]
MKWLEAVDCLTNCLAGLEVSDVNGASLDVDAGFHRLCLLTKELKERNGTIFLAGNGASASMASHVAADLAKNAHIRTEVFSDLALITAVANDISYDDVFAEPLRRRMHEGDLFVAISSSGNSPNVVKACEKARSLGGSVFTLSAMGAQNKIRSLGDLNFYLPGDTYGMAESGHAAVLHHWIDTMVADCEE